VKPLVPDFLRGCLAGGPHPPSSHTHSQSVVVAPANKPGEFGRRVLSGTERYFPRRIRHPPLTSPRKLSQFRSPPP
jgi:hypothetical protein